jgi:hypothetical protein
MQVNLSDEALFETIAGAGATYTYGWYLETEIDLDALRLKVVLDNGEDGRESATLTPGTIRRVINTCFDERPDYTHAVRSIDWSDPECDSEVDADVADTIIQYAVLGRVIFG